MSNEQNAIDAIEQNAEVLAPTLFQIIEALDLDEGFEGMLDSALEKAVRKLQQEVLSRYKTNSAKHVSSALHIIGETDFETPQGTLNGLLVRIEFLQLFQSGGKVQKETTNRGYYVVVADENGNPVRMCKVKKDKIFVGITTDGEIQYRDIFTTIGVNQHWPLVGGVHVENAYEMAIYAQYTNDVLAQRLDVARGINYVRMALKGDIKDCPFSIRYGAENKKAAVVKVPRNRITIGGKALGNVLDW